MIGQEEHMRTRTGFALATILAVSGGQAMGATHAPRPAAAMSCQAFKARLAEEVAKGGDRVIDPEFSPAAVADVSGLEERHAFSNVRGLSGDLTCGASDDHFVIVEAAADVPQLDDEAIAKVLRIKALAAAALGVVVDLSAPEAKRAVEGVVDEARRAFASDDLRGEINPRGFAFRRYSDVPGGFDAAQIAVSFERGKVSIAVSGAAQQ
jgi:hypothetical protein